MTINEINEEEGSLKKNCDTSVAYAGRGPEGFARCLEFEDKVLKDDFFLVQKLHTNQTFEKKKLCMIFQFSTAYAITINDIQVFMKQPEICQNSTKRSIGKKKLAYPVSPIASILTVRLTHKLFHLVLV